MAAPPATDDRIATAVALRLASAACLATMNAFIKLAEAGGAHLVEILFFRQALGIPLVAGVIALGPGLATIRTQRFGAHLVRTIVGLTSMTCLFIAVMLLPLAESTTLAFTVPIFATVLGALVLKEPTGWHRWGAVLAGFAGVLVVAQPGSGHFPFWGAVAGIAAAFLTAVVSILLRRIGRTEHLSPPSSGSPRSRPCRCRSPSPSTMAAIRLRPGCGCSRSACAAMPASSRSPPRSSTGRCRSSCRWTIRA